MMSASRRFACGGAARRSGVSSTAASAGICTDDATSGTSIAEVQRSAKETRTTGCRAGASSCSDEIFRAAGDAASAGIFTTVDNVLDDAVGALLVIAEVVSGDAKAAAGRSPSESDAVCRRAGTTMRSFGNDASW